LIIQDYAAALQKVGANPLNSIGISESAIVDLKYYDYARSKYLALGMKDTMP
jgi:hypothetical protein